MALKLNKSTSFLKNIGWNLIASLLTAGVVQLAVFPFLGKVYSEEQYGNILYVVGVVNVILLTFGNSLGDIRLTLAGRYRSDRTGEFNLLLLLVSLLGVLILLAFLVFNTIVDTSTTVFLLIYCFLGVFNSYLVAILRMRLMFRQNFILSIFTVSGYLVGMALFFVVKNWALIFSAAYTAAVAYLTVKTCFLRDGFRVTPQIGTTLRQYSQLSFSYAMKSSLSYVDRFINYPMLGAEGVATYTVAIVLGKCVSLVLQPLANVLLGYYAQPSFKMTRKKYWLTNMLTFALGAVSFAMTLAFSRLFITIFYPTYAHAVRPFLVLANLSAILNALSSMIQPALLRYADMKWQIILQAVYTILCVGLALLLIPKFALLGFCYAMLIASVVNLLLMMLVGDLCMMKQGGHNAQDKQLED